MSEIKLELAKIDPYNCSLDDLKSEIKRLENIRDEYNGIQHSIKIFINSVYGATASIYFTGYNVFVAEAITLQGQDLILFANSILDDYFLNHWHEDTETHKALGLNRVNKILAKTVTVYNDTDSVASDTLLITEDGKKTIKEFYEENEINGSAGDTLMGHKSILTNKKILNWSNENNNYYAKVKRIIKHKVKKDKWLIKTKSGKEIIITGDHSMVVFRDGNQITVKPADILKTDKILCVNSPVSL